MDQPAWKTVYIGLGSNLGDRGANLRAALAALSGLAGVAVDRVSTFIETAPVGPPGVDVGGPFLNAVAELSTSLSARALLGRLLSIEASLGRVRDARQRWTARTLDLDLLIYGNETIDEPGLTVPHPRLLQREFVLRPMAELAPDLVIPGQVETVRVLLDRIVPVAAETGARDAT